MDRIWIASLSGHAEAVNGGDVVLFDPLAVVVILLHDSHARGGHEEHCHTVLLAFLPDNAWVWSDWLSLEKH